MSETILKLGAELNPAPGGFGSSTPEPTWI
jgi:hypothetical protein